MSYNTRQVEALVLIRDGTAMIQDGINRLLDTEEPEDQLPKPTEQQINSLEWVSVTSKTGSSYEQTENDNSKEFRILQNWLGENKGFAQLYGFKFWFHMSDENLVDRRKS
ncbi:hypothetical protein JW988_03480 [Candidatus Bathyarchaeota archaeon]|nr:hypothetical protein [Candidatus Bathyarchaeota archaeon]